METRTLVLTKSYMPHLIVGWFEAVGMIFTNKVDVIEEYPGDEQIVGRIPEHRTHEFKAVCRSYGHSGGDLVIRVPAVVRLHTWEGGVRRAVKFSRDNVFTRDGFKCQYCGSTKSSRDLNFDHVLPRKQGGKTTWDNITTSCYRCNSQKGGHTPRQAGMQLRKHPYKPKYLPMTGPRIEANRIHELWIPYLPAANQVA